MQKKMHKMFVICLIIITSMDTVTSENSHDRGLSQDLGRNLFQNLETGFSECLDYVVKRLEEFNDSHIGTSYLGKLMHYEEIKPRSVEMARQGKSVKKMSMAMMPLVFHVGATSTWLMLTSVMTVKSVAIGLALLVFKIAVSAAKVSSFFTTLKNKQNEHYHHHGHDRSMTDAETTNVIEWPSSTTHGSEIAGSWSGHAAEVAPYKTIPDTYLTKEPHGGFEYKEADD